MAIVPILALSIQTQDAERRKKLKASQARRQMNADTIGRDREESTLLPKEDPHLVRMREALEGLRDMTLDAKSVEDHALHASSGEAEHIEAALAHPAIEDTALSYLLGSEVVKGPQIKRRASPYSYYHSPQIEVNAKYRPDLREQIFTHPQRGERVLHAMLRSHDSFPSNDATTAAEKAKILDIALDSNLHGVIDHIAQRIPNDIEDHALLDKLLEDERTPTSSLHILLGSSALRKTYPDATQRDAYRIRIAEKFTDDADVAKLVTSVAHDTPYRSTEALMHPHAGLQTAEALAKRILFTHDDLVPALELARKLAEFGKRLPDDENKTLIDKLSIQCKEARKLIGIQHVKTRRKIRTFMESIRP